MARNYFNSNIYDKLIKISNKDINSGIKMCEEYMEEYPMDCGGYITYASLLIKLGRFDEALTKIKEAETMLKCSTRKNEIKNLMMKEIAYLRIKMACYQGNYEETLELCKENKQLLIGFDINLGSIVGYCRNRLGIYTQDRDEKNSYLVNQIIEYSYDDFREHIKKHHIDTRQEDDKGSYFLGNFRIEDVLKEVYKKIPSDNRCYLGFVDNYYIFRYDNCGKCHSEADRRKSPEASRCAIKNADYFEVVTLPNSGDIITMYPCETSRGFPYVDLNYLKDEEKPSMKRKSQIDKFNERYKNY